MRLTLIRNEGTKKAVKDIKELSAKYSIRKTDTTYELVIDDCHVMIDNDYDELRIMHTKHNVGCVKLWLDWVVEFDEHE